VVKNRAQMLLMSENVSREKLSEILNQMVDDWDNGEGPLWPDVEVYIIDDMEPE